MLTRRTVILAERESVYGTDPQMTGSNGMYAYDVELDIRGDVLARDILRDTLTPMAHVLGIKEIGVNFKTEIKGAGMTGTVPTLPEIQDLLSACGFDTGVYTGTTLVFSLVSAESNINSVALKVYKDGNLHKVTGARGKVKFNLEAGKYGVAEWALQGLYNAVIANTIPDLAGTPTTLPPIAYNASFQIAGFSPVSSKMAIDLGITVVRRDSLNAIAGVQSFRITGRKPTMEFDADAVVESSNPFWGDWIGNIVDTYSIQVGSTAGNMFKLNGYFEYETNKYADKDGVSSYECKAALISSDQNTSNDELTLTFI